MKQFSSVLASLLLLTRLTLAASPKPDSLQINRLERIEKGFDKLSHINDSLNKELLYFRAKEDYYSAAMTRQGDHLEWMIGLWITVIVSVAGLITWSAFKLEINKARRESRQETANIITSARELNQDYLRLKHKLYVSSTILFNNSVAYNPPDVENYNLLDISLDACIVSVQFSADAYLIEQQEIEINRLDEVNLIGMINTSLDNTDKAIVRIENYLDTLDNQEERKEKINALRDDYERVFEVLDLLKSNQEEPFDFKVESLKERFRKLFKDTIV